uniref:protein disulfide-isomerase n=1 Tax=Schistosoma mansoni TaxID=6183 RepID=A0A3Q0KSZ2_SCHMA
MYRWTVLFLLLSPALCLFNTNDDVIKLTDQNFDKVISSKELWFIMFYASWCGHSKNAAPDWKLFATNFKGIIKVAAVDSENNPTVTQRFSVKGFPTILIFGDNKNSPKPYTGGRDIDHLNKEALRELTSLVKTRTGSGSSDGSDKDDVIELTDSNFDEKVLNSQEPWLVEFFAPWCGHCKNLKPHWDKAARELKGTVKVAALDATVHSRMAQKYGIRGYPTIKFFPAGPKTDDPIDYDGARSSDAIVAWAMEKADASAPAPEIVELTSASILKEACEDHPLCIISVFPMLFDCQSDCRKKYLNLLKTEADKFKKQKWGWIWTEALKHSDLENVLDIGGSGYPAMVAVHGRKKKRTTLRGAYSSTGVHDFLRQLSVGGSNLPLYDVSSLPEIKTVEAWDGKDAPPTEEQDYDDLKVEL